jgi:hypothetical protein
MLRLLKNEGKINNPYNIGDEVEFYNRYGVWEKGFIVDFEITDYVYKAVIKCYNNFCYRFHYKCICSNHLRKRTE